MTRSMLIIALAGLATPAAGLASPPHKAADRTVQAVAAMEYLFVERGVFELVAAPGQITDIVLEPGETLVETNPIAAGDTARWVIGDTTSGEGGSRRVHVLVKPVQSGLSTNLIINTTRRSYHLQMRASSRAYLSQVAWRYPQAPNLAPAVLVKPVVLVSPPAPPAPVTFNLGYRIKGEARWRPARVYDDGARTYVEFGPAIALSDLPPLYGLGPDGKTSELINYRLEGRRLVVDRLFDRAELRFGLKRWERRVRIERTAPAREAAQ
ncbi:P-type conjugative transfer protein TrbG [Caulobacter vibrioides]|jgi:type IV secretion system protein VirB9|uniref:P-type conjugative transfer protein TrbG n=1 Tax=Caulobacter vibrioides TaxID=155892 RepID=UPI000BB50381|nr:P-type conjugative transfer protein TrbG [Caulobacter vibrioides]ATC28482.1 P-type conjugative transfer protein TrbG [Caulobacter vibrioides]